MKKFLSILFTCISFFAYSQEYFSEVELKSKIMNEMSNDPIIGIWIEEGTTFFKIDYPQVDSEGKTNDIEGEKICYIRESGGFKKYTFNKEEGMYTLESVSKTTKTNAEGKYLYHVPESFSDRGKMLETNAIIEIKNGELYYKVTLKSVSQLDEGGELKVMLIRDVNAVKIFPVN